MRWATLVAGGVWGAGLATAVWTRDRNVMHPGFIPLGLIFIVGVTATIYGVLPLMVWLVRGPDRWRGFAWGAALLIFGALWGAPMAWGQLTMSGRSASVRWRQIPLVSSWLESAVPYGAALLDGITRLVYPQRLEGRKCVMIYRGGPAGGAAVAAMDRHIEALERLLGRTCEGKVHWVRGRLFGVGGVYFQGMAFGSDWKEQVDHQELDTLDRHEVAHFVAENLAGPYHEAPAMLQEGWAESQSLDPGRLAWRTLGEQMSRGGFCIDELVDADSYLRRDYRPYNVGGALVDYVLRRHGGPKFLELYSTCRFATFAADCQRVLGVGPAELDRLLADDVARQTASYAPRREGCEVVHFAIPLETGELESIAIPVFVAQSLIEKRQPPADVAARDAFWSEYPAALFELAKAYRQFSQTVRLSMERDASPPLPASALRSRVSFAQDGLRRLFTERTDGGETVVVAARNRSFWLYQAAGDKLYRRVGDDGAGRVDDGECYRLANRWYSLVQPTPYSFYNWSVPELLAHPDLVLRDIVGVENGGQPLIKVTFDGPHAIKEGFFTLEPSRGWAVVEAGERSEFSGSTMTSSSLLTYDPHRAGTPVLVSEECSSASSMAGWQTAHRAAIESLTFGPLDDALLDAARYRVAPRESFGLLPGAATLAGVLMVAGVIAFGIGRWRQSRVTH